MKPVRLSYFTAVSGLGWCIDFALFNYLVHGGMASGSANMISASVAVTFVFVSARRWIFRDHAGSLAEAIAKYVVWNVVAIALASLAVRLIAGALGTIPLVVYDATLGAMTGIAIPAPMLAAICAKVMVTPLTMYANFVAMGYIIERRLSFI